MKQIRVGDITIDAVIEREGPWRRPQDFFPAYDDGMFKHHLPTMEPEVFDATRGMMVITYQTFVVRTPRYTILVPLYREAQVLPALVDGLLALDYPGLLAHEPQMAENSLFD